MRFMLLVKATKDSEAGVMPSTELLTEMGKYNEELVKAGVMLAGEGLAPTSQGKRIRFDGKKRTVVDGPFAETKELIAGFWLWQVKSMSEAVEWLKRAPFDGGTEVEIRRVFENQARKVVDGPFAETKELIAGFWIWEVKSFQEAIDWAKRIPNPTGEEGVVELRPVFEAEDFGAELTPELREQEERLRAQIEKQTKS